MKISERLARLAEDGMVTSLALEKAREKNWVTAQELSAMSDAVEQALVRETNVILDAAVKSGVIEKQHADLVKAGAEGRLKK